MTYDDILYEKRDGMAWITINRPEVRNAFRGADRRRADPRVPTRLADRDVGVVRAHRGRRQGLLLGRRPEGARPRRLRRAASGIGHRRATALHSVIRAHPEAGHRHGERLRDRRRPRPARALRSLDRRRHRHLRADRSARRQRRSRLRHGLSGARRRREEGARDLVPVPAVHGRRGARDGPGQQGRAGRRAARRGRGVVPRAPREEPDGARSSPSSPSTPTPSTGRRHRVRVHGPRALLPDPRGQEGRNAFVEKRPVNFSKFRT